MLDHGVQQRLNQRHVPPSVATMRVDTTAELPENPHDGHHVWVSAEKTSYMWNETTEQWEVFAGELAGGGAVKFTQETFVLPTSGAQTIQLTYEPIPGSEHVYWYGLYQEEGDAWVSDENYTP